MWGGEKSAHIEMGDKEKGRDLKGFALHLKKKKEKQDHYKVTVFSP